MATKKATTTKAPAKKAATTKATAKKAPAKKAVTKGKLSPLEKARKALDDAKVENQIVSLDDSIFKESMAHIPSGSVAIDYLIGGALNQFGVSPCPGWPRARIVNLYGRPGAGKTTMALTACAQACAMGGTAAYIDWENEVEPRYASVLGVPVTDDKRFVLVQPESLEQGLQYIMAYAAGGVDIIVLDSVGAGVPKRFAEEGLAEIGEGKDKRMGMVASIWSKSLPKIKRVLRKSGTCMIGISQLRKAINAGPYAKDYVVQGGEAWKFYSAIRMFLRPGKKDKTNFYDPMSHKYVKQVSGHQVFARLEKCKVSPAFDHDVIFYLRSGEGIDDLRTLIDMGVAHKIIKKKGSWYEWHTSDGKEIRGQGMDKFREAILEEPHGEDMIFSTVAHLFGVSPEGLFEESQDPEDMEIAAAIQEIIGGSLSGEDPGDTE